MKNIDVMPLHKWTKLFIGLIRFSVPVRKISADCETRRTKGVYLVKNVSLFAN